MEGLEEQEGEELRVLGLNVLRHPLSSDRCRLKLAELGVTDSRRILEVPHGRRVRAAGILESLQSPPTKSGKPIWFLQIEDEHGLLQATIFNDVYQRWGAVIHQTGAYLLEGRVEQDRRRGFSFLVERIQSLGDLLAAKEVPLAKAAPTPRSLGAELDTRADEDA